MFQPIDEFFLKESIPLVGLRASTWDDLAEDYVDELTQATSRLLKNAVWRRIFSMCAAATTGEMGGDPRGMRGNRYDIASYLILQTDSSRCGQKLRNANAVVSGCRQHEEPFNQRPPAMSGLAQAAHRLNPSEGMSGRLRPPIALSGVNAGIFWPPSRRSFVSRPRDRLRA